MRDDPVVITLIARARDEDQHTWNERVDRYAPLVWSICKRYELSRRDIDDIGQTVWLLLVEQVGNLRQPALAGWLATTTHRECLRVMRAATRYDPFPVTGRQPRAARSAARDDRPGGDRGGAEGRASRGVRRASSPLPETAVPAAQRAPDLLRGDQRPALPIESIGPRRGRCLDRLRRSPSLAAFTDSDLQASVAGSAPSRDTGGVPSA